jgi:hypothetical protein
VGFSHFEPIESYTTPSAILRSAVSSSTPAAIISRIVVGFPLELAVHGFRARIVVIDDGVDEPVIDGHADEALREHTRSNAAR